MKNLSEQHGSYFAGCLLIAKLRVYDMKLIPLEEYQEINRLKSQKFWAIERVARLMLAHGVPLQEVAEITEFSIEDLQDYVKEMSIYVDPETRERLKNLNKRYETDIKRLAIELQIYDKQENAKLKALEEVTHKMLARGMSLSEVAKYIELPVGDLQELMLQ
jgi:predicted DNA-binding protein